MSRLVDITVGLFVVLVLVGVNGMFVALEFGMLAADRSRLEARADEGSARARLTVGALRRLSFYLSGAQLGITLTSLVLGFLSEPIVGGLIEPVLSPIGVERGSAVSAIIAILLATVFQMVVGELVPKNLAIAHPDAVALAVAPPSRLVFAVLSPVIVSFNGMANWAVRRLGVEPQEELAAVRSLEEIEYLIRSSGETGSLTEDELALLRRTLRFADKTAAEALTPRVHVSALGHEAVTGELLSLTVESGHSHYPVYGEDLDDIRGVISVTKLLDLDAVDRHDHPVAALMDDAQVVPETRFLVDLLDDFENTGAELVIVVDEHGGTAGIITLEDVLEEITGDIDDEYDVEPPLTVVRPGVSVVAGTLTADEVAETNGFAMPPGDYETIAGFLLDQLGRIPDEGEQVQWEGWVLEVIELDRLRIASVQMVAPAGPSASGPAGEGESG